MTSGLELELRRRLTEAEHNIAHWTYKRDELLKALKGFEPKPKPVR